MPANTGYPNAKAVACVLACLLALVAIALACRASRAASVGSTDPLAGYYGNSLVCQNQTTHAVCHVWLDPDGRYHAFYDLGPQSAPAGIDGPFAIEGREGRYTLIREGGVAKVCLAPQPYVKLAAEQTGELFSEATCYPLAAHRPGDKWSIEWAGARYTLWLLAGR